MAKAPPSRSYRLFSGMVCLACAYALFAPANTVIGAAVRASPATTLRLEIELEIAGAMVISLVMATGLIRLEHAVWSKLTAFAGPPIRANAASPWLRAMQNHVQHRTVELQHGRCH